jgi:protein-tyrosine phosphatase
MIPLVDMHCHLLAGLDDGPRTENEALAMCRIAYEEGVRFISATAHQNERWASVTPERIRQTSIHLSEMLRKSNIALTVFPCAEIMAHPGIEVSWRAGDLMSVADRGKYLLVEMPPAVRVDVAALVRVLIQTGIRPMLAHPERHEELLHEAGVMEGLIRAGCLVQVSAGSIVNPACRRDERALKSWFRRGVVHLVGSDGHSRSRRPPRVKAAYERIQRWAGNAMADRVCSTNGMAILQGLTPRVPEPTPRWSRWLPKLW